MNSTKVKVVCECGSTVNKYGLPRHKRSAKHIKLMKPIDSIIDENIDEYWKLNIKLTAKVKYVYCECGSRIRKDGLVRHKKTKKHFNLMITKATNTLDMINNLPVELTSKVMLYTLEHPTAKCMKQLIHLYKRFCKKYETYLFHCGNIPFNFFYHSAYYSTPLYIFYPDIYENEEFKE